MLNQLRELASGAPKSIIASDRVFGGHFQVCRLLPVGCLSATAAAVESGGRIAPAGGLEAQPGLPIARDYAL